MRKKKKEMEEEVKEEEGRAVSLSQQIADTADRSV